jgi:hypothetical protein
VSLVSLVSVIRLTAEVRGRADRPAGSALLRTRFVDKSPLEHAPAVGAQFVSQPAGVRFAHQRFQSVAQIVVEFRRLRGRFFVEQVDDLGGGQAASIGIEAFPAGEDHRHAFSGKVRLFL